MNLTFSEAVENYLSDVSKRCKASTRGHYKKRLSSFIRDLGSKQLTELDATTIKNHLEQESKWRTGDRAGQLKAPDTIRSTVISWEQLQKWLVDNDHLANPITKKKLPKPAGRKRDTLATKEELKAILALVPAYFLPIFSAMRLTGARPGELCSAEISHFDREAGQIVLTKHKTDNKTSIPRQIPVAHPSLIKIIDDQIGMRTEGYIFRKPMGGRWRPENISLIFRNARDKAGVRKEVVPYLTRHAFGSAVYDHTEDIKAVADSLGHSNIATSMRYARRNLKLMAKNQRLFDDSLD